MGKMPTSNLRAGIERHAAAATAGRMLGHVVRPPASCLLTVTTGHFRSVGFTPCHPVGGGRASRFGSG